MAKRDYSLDPIPYSPNHVNHLPPDYSKSGNRHRPRIDWARRILWGALLVYVLAYFAMGIWIDDLPIPSRWSRNVTHLHGVSIWLLLGAFVSLLAGEFWNYSKRNAPEYSSIQPPFFLPSDLVPMHGGKVALSLICLAWILYLASLASMFIPLL